jgi:hypothetical protein
MACPLLLSIMATKMSRRPSPPTFVATDSGSVYRPWQPSMPSTSRLSRVAGHEACFSIVTSRSRSSK